VQKYCLLTSEMDFFGIVFPESDRGETIQPPPEDFSEK
jgi:hypothetical protein